MAADPEVHVERVVNRLHDGYDSAETAGYRDVALNLLLETADTVNLGLNWHVCEVQLVLISFAKIKVSLSFLNFPIISQIKMNSILNRHSVTTYNTMGI